MNRWFFWLILFAGLALAAPTRAGEVIATLSASGQIEIGPDGTVRSHRIDERVPPSVAEAISRTVANWTFEPIIENGRPVIAVTRMHLLVEAIEHSGDGLALRLGRVWFGDEVIPIKTRAPVYPSDAVAARVGAQVVLALRLDEEGKVIDAHPWQTNFAKGTRARDAKRFRRSFERASVDAARKWRYSPAISGPGGVTILVPVQYSLATEGRLPGEWVQVTPGEVVPPPWGWEPPAAVDGGSPADGFARLEDRRIRLLGDPTGSVL